MENDLKILESQLAKGLGYSDMLGFTNQNSIEENKILLHSILEILISKGLVRMDEIEKRKSDVEKYFKENNTNPKINLLETPDKYDTVNNIEIDCPNLISLCKGSCCKLNFALSVQDLKEGIVKWNYTEPYVIAKKEDGYCTHCDKSKNCTVYEHRPIICRTYDCRGDKRIWLDFENKVPNPNLEDPNWPHFNVKEKV